MMTNKIGKALVVGAGISGIRSALDLAETGYGVVLIDRAPHIGGILSQLDYQFPTNHCGMCKMLPLVQRDAASQFCLRKGLFHENIEILLGTEISAIEGEPGNFQVSLRESPTWVDPDLCIGCGACTDVCPVQVPDTFNAGLASRKAIYLPVPHAIPNPYVIDLAACTHCGACEEICPTGAVQLAADQRKAFRILVVDDEQIVRDSLKEWLVDEGFSVDTAASGAEAMAQLEKTAYNLMLTDIKMPGMDGVELLQAASAAYPDLAVLMMTAYATVETAVDAMKIGALDYLVKPFDPETLVPTVVKTYEALEATRYRKVTVGAVVLAGGTAYYHPDDEKNVYEYGINPGVVTSLEFERMLSGTGPSRGQLLRPHDGQPIRKIAWFQCVGSRDIQRDADFCSSICCMYAIKEALLAKERGGEQTETAIFYMDMRAFGKSFQRYRDRAETDHGVRFERSRIHSVTTDEATGAPVVRYVRTDGTCVNESFDLVVLAVGQRPSPGTDTIAQMADISLNRWGFVETEALAPCETGKHGLLAAGSYSGLKDISESVIFASAAAAEASRVIHSIGGGLADTDRPAAVYRDVSRETPRILVTICSCGSHTDRLVDADRLTRTLGEDPSVDRVVFLEHSCTAAGWDQIEQIARECRPNRMLIGACHPYLYVRKLKELGRSIELDPALMDVVDILTPALRQAPGETMAESDQDSGPDDVYAVQLATLNMAISRLRHLDPLPAPTVPVVRRALVVGGGIAGMHAALTVAAHGYPVDLVEVADRLGGNLNWLHRTIDGQNLALLLEKMVQQVEKHPNLTVHLNTTVTGSFGEVGRFLTTVASDDGAVETLNHGAVILATGGGEAPTTAYGCGTSRAIITQKEMESRLAGGTFDADGVGAVVMIQCVDCRQEPRNYCSRVCCVSALKHALALKAADPEVAVYILYRDIMTYGFSETYYTQARKAGVIFIQYDLDSKPGVDAPQADDGPVRVTVTDPLLGRPVEIAADLVVLATGIVPNLPPELARTFGADTDVDGFFAEAESKWRPVDALKEGVFACGIALGPRSVPESIATAGAAAQRTVRILSHERLAAGKIVAVVHHSLCSLCERCIDACPYGARMLDVDEEKVRVNPARCQGCGACAAVCPNSASELQGFSEPLMFDVIDAALEGTGT